MKRKRGGDILDVFKGPRKGASPTVRKFLKEHGNDRIVKLNVGKTAVNSTIDKALNILSFGRYAKKKKELGYDKLNHAFLEFELESGQRYRMEKITL
jgi:hypothetical protein